MSEDFEQKDYDTRAPLSQGPSISISESLIAANLAVQAVSLGDVVFENLYRLTPPIELQPPTIGAPELGQIFVPTLFANRGFGRNILYRAATGFEKAMSDTDAERLTSLNAELIRDIWIPWACPTRLLPYLAWAMSVQFWNDDWSETTKRAWIEAQFLFKSLRGTRKALEMAIDYSGRDVSPYGYRVLDVTTAPQKIFSGPSLTRDEREDWLQKLPQVRVWRRNEVAFFSEFKAFYGSSAVNRLHSRRFCLSGSNVDSKVTASIPTTAIERLKRVSRWIENGVETDVRVSDFGSFFQLHKTGLEDGSVYSGRPFGLSRHYIPSTAHNRLLTIQPTPALPWRSQMTPSLQAVTSEPERVKVPGTRKHSVFSNTPLHDFFVPTTAPFRIFQRYSVLDPTTRQLRRTPVQFMGVGRYGFPSFTAWVSVSAASTLPRWAPGFGYWVPKTKFYTPHDGKPIERIKQAAVASKALRDKILLKIGPTPRFLAGEKPVLAGIDTVPAGSI